MSRRVILRLCCLPRCLFLFQGFALSLTKSKFPLSYKLIKRWKKSFTNLFTLPVSLTWPSCQWHRRASRSYAAAAAATREWLPRWNLTLDEYRISFSLSRHSSSAWKTSNNNTANIKKKVISFFFEEIDWKWKFSFSYVFFLLSFAALLSRHDQQTKKKMKWNEIGSTTTSQRKKVIKISIVGRLRFACSPYIHYKLQYFFESFLKSKWEISIFFLDFHFTKIITFLSCSKLVTMGHRWELRWCKKGSPKLKLTQSVGYVDSKLIVPIFQNSITISHSQKFYIVDFFLWFFFIFCATLSLLKKKLSQLQLIFCLLV